MYVCMYVCMYACMYVCMYVCMYICMCVYIYIYIYINTHKVLEGTKGGPKDWASGESARLEARLVVCCCFHS